MMETLFDTGARAKITPRDYQIQDHDESFRLWNSGTVGTLTRLATGLGKTICACLKADTWLRRSPDHRVMVISYETQLVGQFAQEIEDVLGIEPGIEMDESKVNPDAIPPIVVASRASLLVAQKPNSAEIEELEQFGIKTIGAVPQRKVKTYLKHLRKGLDIDVVTQDIERQNAEPEAHGDSWSRVHKFDYKMPWLLIFDEAHRHAYHLTSVGHIVDWFGQNPESRRNGLTATPKRGDGVSIGEVMFPGVAVDYPLYSPHRSCAVKDGYAVPYLQQYIEVEGVDFKSLAKIGEDFDEHELERVLGEEEQLAKLIEPMLDIVGDRRTLIFSPGVEMAKNVARYINARVQCLCPCGKKKWHPALLVGDGVKCLCGRMAEPADIVKHGEQAKELDGNTPERDRKDVYRDHQSGKFQFLSVCGLCREGYNDPDIAAVAIFRPVSRKASSLAEQMKGRGCRTKRGCIDGLKTAGERLAAIAASDKPNCIIVDLVGVTGLADCASTVQIYAEGLPDEVAERAEEILVEQGLEGETDVEGAINQAVKEDEDARERVRIERENAELAAKEEAERRAKAGAEVQYTTHEVGYGGSGPKEASDGQYKYMARLGMTVKALVSKAKAGRIIGMLRARKPLETVAYECGLEEGSWEKCLPTPGQVSYLRRLGLPPASCSHTASLMIEAKKDPDKCMGYLMDAIGKARKPEDLYGAGMDVKTVVDILPKEQWDHVVEFGKQRRKEIG